MSIAKGYKHNFTTLCKAVKADACCLMEVREHATGKTRVAVCALNRDGDEVAFVPLAIMAWGNPYELFDPPDPKGGFIDQGTTKEDEHHG